MRDFKGINREGVSDIRENGQRTTELGTKMLGQAEQIKAVLESIDLEDIETVEALDVTENRLDRSFDGAYNDEVVLAGQELGQQGQQIKETVGNELDNVNSGIGKLEQAGGISEIGNADIESGRSELEGSAEEYETIITDEEHVVDDIDQTIKTLQSNLDSIFG